MQKLTMTAAAAVVGCFMAFAPQSDARAAERAGEVRHDSRHYLRRRKW